MSDATRGQELHALCKACGACCSGAVFGFVPLEPGELAPDARRRLKVFREGEGDRFKLPCAALEGTACGVYQHRPEMCRAYYCKLYADHEADGADFGGKLETARRIRELLDRIRAHADAEGGAWLPAPIAEIAQWDASKIGALRESVGEETLLDIAELGMRVRRDLGHVPKRG